MKFNTHKDLANEIEKKEMDQYKEVEKEIEEIEKRFLNEGEKIEKEEIEDMFADKEESEIKEILNSKNSNILNKIKEIIPNIKKLEIINNKSLNSLFSSTSLNDINQHCKFFNGEFYLDSLLLCCSYQKN